ncbi:hypothetical protein V6Z11_A11G269500 [Gossypium hirsutum]
MPMGFFGEFLDSVPSKAGEGSKHSAKVLFRWLYSQIQQVCYCLFSFLLLWPTVACCRFSALFLLLWFFAGTDLVNGNSWWLF